MPILGVIASSTRQGLSTGSYESIATVTVGGGGQSTVTFSSIPSTYSHLQVRAVLRSTRGFTADTLNIVYNNETSSIYSATALNSGNGTGTGSNYSIRSFPRTNIETYEFPASGSVGDSFGAFTLDILNYSSTTRTKVTRMLAGFDNRSTGAHPGNVILGAGFCNSTSAITSIRFSFATGPNFAAHSRFALYGIRNAV